MNLFESLPFKTVKQALNDPIKDTGSNNVTNDKLTTKELGLKKNFLDVIELIRSIQRTEGNPDCFRRAKGYCDQLGCAWRLYCLEKPQHLPY
jgi:hypothetical protein